MRCRGTEGFRKLGPASLGLLVFVPSACGPSPDAAPSESQAPPGVEWIRNEGPAYPDVPLLPLTEDLRIGAAEGPEELVLFRVSRGTSG